MAEFGAKASQKGFDVDSAADYQLLFSSLWPTLKIVSQGAVTITNTNADQTIATHNLGYCPAFLVFITSNNSSFPGSRIAYNTFDISVNTSTLKWTADASYPSGTETIYYYLYYMDLGSIVTASIIDTTPTVRNTATGYGIKTTLSGYNALTDIDYRHFSVHSDCRSPIVHMVGHGTLVSNGVDNSFTITHNLGYIPLNFLYLLNGDGSYSLQSFGGNQTYFVVNTTTTITVHSAGTTTLSYIVFKDPLILN